MKAPDVIAVSPSKDNISYAVRRCETLTDTPKVTKRMP